MEKTATHYRDDPWFAEFLAQARPLARGYPASAIQGILGGNFLRVAQAVWQ